MTYEFELIYTGATFIEGTRWHEGRWFYSDMYADAVCSIAENGSERRVEFKVSQPSGIGWLPDGTLLVVGVADKRIYRRQTDGEREVYVDLAEQPVAWLSDMVVGDDGHVWVSQIGFDVAAGAPPTPAEVLRIDPDRSVHVAAADLLCPNGMLITPDRRTFIVAESVGGRYRAFDLGPDQELSNPRVFSQLAPTPKTGSWEELAATMVATPDGCAIDSAGEIWGADLVGGKLVHLASDGAIIDTIPAPDGLTFVACALGGSDGRTLLLSAAPDFDETKRRGADDAVLFTTRVEVGRGGLP